MALGVATGPAAEDKVWTTFTFGTPGTLAVSTTDPDSETIESLAAIYGITFVETTATLEPVATGVKHIILRDVDAGGRVTKGVGPTALNNCTAFASNPGFPFQITNANLPYAQDFNLTPTTDAEDWRGGCIDGLSSGDGKEAFVQFTPSVTGQYLITGHFYRDATPSTARAANVSVWELPGCTGSQPSSGASTLVGCNTDLFGNSQIVVTLNAGQRTTSFRTISLGVRWRIPRASASVGRCLRLQDKTVQARSISALNHGLGLPRTPIPRRTQIRATVRPLAIPLL